MKKAYIGLAAVTISVIFHCYVAHAADHSSKDILISLADMAWKGSEMLQGGKNITGSSPLFPMVRIDNFYLRQGATGNKLENTDFSAYLVTEGEINPPSIYTLISKGKAADILKAKTIAINKILGTNVVGKYRTAYGSAAGDARSVTMVAGIYTIPDVRLVARHTFIGAPPMSTEISSNKAMMGLGSSGLDDALEQMRKWVDSLAIK